MLVIDGKYNEMKMAYRKNVDEHTLKNDKIRRDSAKDVWHVLQAAYDLSLMASTVVMMA
jgi:hypothetical protein